MRAIVTMALSCVVCACGGRPARVPQPDPAVVAGAVAVTAATLEVVRQAKQQSPDLPASEHCCMICDACSFPCGDSCVPFGTMCTEPQGCACTDSKVNRDDRPPQGEPGLHCPAPGEARILPVQQTVTMD
ncbi:MAG: hypothetical protein JRI55_29480 [Deltaproteobacteria bacterium]|nr:hypothetical protein [Deltaproteobacteria bacterium]